MILDELEVFAIVFDSPDTGHPPVFSGGDEVSGRVVVQLSAACSVQSLRLQAKGLAEVQFTEYLIQEDVVLLRAGEQMKHVDVCVEEAG